MSPRAARARRWVTVSVVTAAVVALPWTIGHIPRTRNSVSAADLLARVQHSTATGYSGYAESQGTLALPVTSQVNGLDDLLGDRTTMRVWWRGAQDWRVDQVATFGEADVHRDAAGIWTWNYESNRATRADQTDEPAARIPIASDLLPPELGRRLLSEAGPSEVRRLPVRRIAGVDAPGLRLSTDAKSSIGRVDVYVHPGTGLPVEVDVYGRDSTLAAVRTSFLDLTVATPAAATTTFVPPEQARVDDNAGFDLVSAANRFFDGQTPQRLAGLDRNTAEQGLSAVGVYGRGVTELVALPLGRNRTAQFSQQLTDAGATEMPLPCSQTGDCQDGAQSYQQVSVGPLSLLLLRREGAAFGRNGGWALTGTVTPATLLAAANELTRPPAFLVGR